MSTDRYILNADHSISPCEDIRLWGRRLEQDRRVAQDHVEQGDRKFWVSTVFLGLDHAFGGSVPIVFETMVFDHSGGEERFSDLYSDRYATWDGAVAGHKHVVDAMRAGTPPDEVLRPDEAPHA